VRAPPLRSTLLILSLALFGSAADAQSLANPTAEMHWRHIGPFRAGRGRAVAGVPSQPNTFYISFDNGGVWRSTDFGSNWFPLFDDQPTGSIVSIAVALSGPNIIYVGAPGWFADLATGDGMQSTDAGKTWTHLGLRNSQMIAYIDVDPKNPNRLFVAVLGHPYGPNEERGIFRSTDGGQTFEKVLYKDEYTSGNDVRIDPANPNIVTRCSGNIKNFIEGGELGAAALFKSTDGGTTWNQLTNGLPANSGEHRDSRKPKVPYALAARRHQPTAYRRGEPLQDHRGGTVSCWAADLQATRSRHGRVRCAHRRRRFLTVAVDPKNENVIWPAPSVAHGIWRRHMDRRAWLAG
jgi:hypothetical protein